MPADTAIVNTILTNGKTRIAAVLGADWTELAREIDLDDNSERNVNKRYGFIPGGGSPAEDELIGTFAITQSFFLVLMTQCDNRDDDVNLRAAREELFDKAWQIVKDFYKTRVGTSDVTGIGGPSFGEPIYLNPGNTQVALSVEIPISFMVSLT